MIPYKRACASRLIRDRALSTHGFWQSSAAQAGSSSATVPSTLTCSRTMRKSIFCTTLIDAGMGSSDMMGEKRCHRMAYVKTSGFTRHVLKSCAVYHAPGKSLVHSIARNIAFSRDRPFFMRFRDENLVTSSTQCDKIPRTVVMSTFSTT